MCLTAFIQQPFIEADNIHHTPLYSYDISSINAITHTW